MLKAGNSSNNTDLPTNAGYDPMIFTTVVNKDFICPICNWVVRKPKECIICGNVFCDICIKNWAEKFCNTF